MKLFQRAERKKAKLRLSIDGPSGSGKTYSSLMVAGGLVEDGKIFLIDTERDSATLEVGKPGIPDFEHATLTPPYTPEKYRQYITAAIEEGADIIIIDSLSHAWSGSGGVLDMHDTATKAQRGGNSWAAWREVTPEHNALVDAILQAESHIICTMRTKTAWEIVDDGSGKKKPIKIGLKPEQREGMEYEFTLVLDLAIEGHVATASKDRTSLFDGKHFIPSYDTGAELADWLDNGRDPVEVSSALLVDLKAKVDEIEAVPHLENWWKKHTPEINRLLPADKEALTAHCSNRKKEIKKK
jgi:hypothetical protein